MNEPVTLVVPNYNGAQYLSQTLAGLLGQTYPNFQVAVVDNCSTDGSVALVKALADSRLRLVHGTEHLRMMGNFNRAIALVETPYFAVCAADEMYESEWLATMVRLLDTYPQAFFGCCKADSADETGRIYLAPAERYKATFWPTAEPCVFDGARHTATLQQGNCLVITTGLFRTAAVKHIGPLNEQYDFVADWEYWFRGFFAGYEIVGTHRPLVHYRRHSQMTTRMLASNLRRFHEELRLCNWIAQAGYEKKVLPTDRPDLGPLRRTLLSEFADRLAAGDSQGARQLVEFGREHIPGFRGSPTHLLMAPTLWTGRLGGRGLKACQWAYLRTLFLLHRK